MVELPCRRRSPRGALVRALRRGRKPSRLRSCRSSPATSAVRRQIFLYSGILERFPRRKVSLSRKRDRANFSYLLETADHRYEAQKLWRGARAQPGNRATLLPPLVFCQLLVSRGSPSDSRCNWSEQYCVGG